jgi:uncharacterized membrane protein
MKYTNKVIINSPIDIVISLWSDPKNYPKWQSGFIKKVPLTGNPNEKGSKSEIYLNHNNKEMKLIETVIESNLPKEKMVLVEHEHMINTMKSVFVDLGGGQTEYLSEIEYVEFKTFLPKVVAYLFPGMFRKQSQQWLDQFKVFVEGLSASDNT